MAREDMTDGAAVQRVVERQDGPAGMPAMVRMPCRSSKVRRRLAPVIFMVVRDASPLLWRDPAEAKKKAPSGATPEGAKSD